MNTFDPFAYEISIRRIVEDGETRFRGTVRELPDVTVYEKSNKAAYDAVICIIEELYKQAVEQEREFPQPFVDEDEFSGRVTLRMPKTLHRQAVTTARVEGVSLNSLIVTVVAARVGVLLGDQRRRASDFLPSYSNWVSAVTYRRDMNVQLIEVAAPPHSAYEEEPSLTRWSFTPRKRAVAIIHAVPTQARWLPANPEASESAEEHAHVVRQ